MSATDPSALALFWVAVIGVAILAYVVLDGFDLGVGILFGATKDAALRDEMVSLLHRVQEEYPHPEGAFWVPQRLGGSAPTVAEAKVLEETEKAARARKRAERGG